MHQLARLYLTASILLAAACGVLPGGASPATGQLPFLLPELPPDTVAASVYDNTDPEWMAPVDVFAVSFRLGLTREEKTRLVVDVGAVELVGGHSFSQRLEDGIYLIRIRSDGTMAPLRKAVDTLNAQTDVVSAFILVGTR